jgi:hypothetical protein
VRSHGSWIYNHLYTCTISAKITTNAVSLNPAHGEVCSIQHYVIKFVSDLRQVGGFLPSTLVSSTNKTDHHNWRYNWHIVETVVIYIGCIFIQVIQYVKWPWPQLQSGSIICHRAMDTSMQEQDGHFSDLDLIYSQGVNN